MWRVLQRWISVRTGISLRERPAPDQDARVRTVVLGDIARGGGYTPGAVVRVSGELVPPEQLLREGDVVFRSRGPYWNAWHVEHLVEPLVAVAPLFVLRCDDDVDPGYVSWWLNSPVAQRYFAAEAMGTGVQMITKAVLLALPFEPPPLPTQRALAKAGALLERERALADQLATLRHDLVTTQLVQHAHATARPTDRNVQP